MSTSISIMEVTNLSKHFGDFQAVKNINFSVEPGEIFGFLGPNGAGKTTTINMLTGLARPTGGSIRINGRDGIKEIAEVQQMIGIVPDESNLYDDLSGYDNLAFCASLYGVRKRERERKAHRLLEQFGLAETGKRPFKAFSKGMKRKLTIAAGIIHDPRILFLDEPTTGIDVESARQIRKLIKDLNDRGTTIFLTTHYIEEAERLCKRVGFIVDGKVVKVDSVGNLMKEDEKEYIIEFTLGEGDLNTPGEGEKTDDALGEGKKAENTLDEEVKGKGTSGKERQGANFQKKGGGGGNSSGNSRVKGYESALDKALVKAFPGVKVNRIDHHRLRIIPEKKTAIAGFIQFFEDSHLPVYEAKIIRPTLEDVFVRITGIEIARMKKEKERGGRKK